MIRLLGLFVLSVAVVGISAAEEKKAVEVPKVGDPAPAISLQATQIEKVLPGKKDATTLTLKDLEGKNVVLFFYPKAMTKGCTIESCGFRDKVEDFAKLDTVVIGISTDTLADQKKFTEKETLKTPLLADPDKKVTAAYGALNTNAWHGQALHLRHRQEGRRAQDLHDGEARRPPGGGADIHQGKPEVR